MVNENILVKLDQNNLINIDPNSVLKDGVIKERELKQEELTIYVNLEAELIKRSKLLIDKEVINIASGTLNTDKDIDYNSKWTDSFTNNEKFDSSSQSFGIDSITVLNKGINTIPIININFIDVRGKVLFENPKNSPYNCFFHLPWPIFYLTLKGYYGKSVRYKLHLVKFNSSYNQNNGNFEIATTFVASTYAYMTDIPLRGIMNSPYLFGGENIVTEKNVNGVKKQVVNNYSLGWKVLDNIFKQYKSKGLIDKDVPTKTLRELGKLSESLDNIIDRPELNDIIDPKIFTSLTNIEDLIKEYQQYIDSYKNKNLNYVGVNNNTLRFKVKSNDNLNLIEGDNVVSLKNIIDSFKNKLSDILKFDKTLKNKKIDYIKINNNFNNNISYYFGKDDDGYYINFSLLLKDFNAIKKNFFDEQIRIEKQFEEELNKSKFYKNLFGFKPTIRNIVGILMANADTFVYLMKNVHEKAFNASEERKNLIKPHSNETIGENIFPWPEIKKFDFKSNTNTIVYPGDSSMINQLKSDNKKLWPEIDFVEEYLAVTTNVYDNNVNKENGVNDFKFNFPQLNENITPINQITNNIEEIYNLLTLEDVTYEIWDKIFNLTTLEKFDKKILSNLINTEFNNLYEKIKYDIIIVNELKKLTNVDEFNKFLYKLSPNEKFLYKKDFIPTTSYIKSKLNDKFKLNLFKDNDFKINNENTDLNTLFNNYNGYKNNLFPFSSKIYDSYNEKNPEKLNNYLKSPYKNNFLNSNINKKLFFNSFNDSIFNDGNESILNTIYFHKQLFEDFKNKDYTASSYLFLNSLPIKFLQDKIDNDISFSTLFKEIGMSHNIPYLYVIKLGSIYHRYKKFITENKDILSNIIDSNGNLLNIDKSILYQNNYNYNFNINDTNISYSSTNHGIYPFYSSIFSQIVNNYTHFDVNDISTYTNNVNNNIIIQTINKNGNDYFFDTFINNKLIDSNNKTYTILPSFFIDELNTNGVDNIDLRIILNNKLYNNDLTTKKIPLYNQYLNKDYNQVFDLIATFDYKVLEEFENLFLNFSQNKLYNNLKYTSFINILKDIVNIDNKITFNKKNITTQQNNQLIDISNKLLSDDYLMTLSIYNPKNINLFEFNKFINSDDVFGIYKENGNNIKLINLFLGQSPTTINYYLEFFKEFNIEINENNLNNLKTIVYYYSHLKHNNLYINKVQFLNSIKTEYINFDKFNYSMNNLIAKFKTLESINVQDENIKFVSGYNNNNLKLELYNYFKSFNDKWISGDSLGNTLLMEECLFLNKANKDIGNDTFLNISKIKDLLDDRNINLNLYSALSTLIENTGFDMRPLPSYVNFYKTKDKIGDMLFGTYLEVDYEDTSPKILFQYSGIASKYVDDMGDGFLYKDDSFDINDIHDNSLIITNIKDIDIDKENKVVAFEVNIGDINQNIFKGVSLDQSSFKNTTESHHIMEMIARSESGSNSYNVDTSLFQIYRQHSYTCEVTAMGNVMIQPSMYFYLNNIPMFKGTYLIIEVTHQIRNNNMTTQFKGIRINKNSLPNPNDSFVSSYKSLFDRIIKQNNIKQ